jgi:hypothetical protein
LLKLPNLPSAVACAPSPKSWLRAVGVGVMASVLVVPSVCSEYAGNATYVYAHCALGVAVLWARSLQTVRRAWIAWLPLSGALVALFASASQSVEQNAAAFGLVGEPAELLAWLPKLLVLCALFVVPERHFNKLALARGGALASDEGWRTAIYAAYALVPMMVLGTAFFGEFGLDEVAVFVALGIGVCLHALQYVRARGAEHARTLFLRRAARGEDPHFRIVETDQHERVLVRVATAPAQATAYRSMDPQEEEVAVVSKAGFVVSV